MKQISIQIQDKALAKEFCKNYVYMNEIVSDRREPEISIPDLTGCLSLLTEPYEDYKLKLVWKELQRLLKDEGLSQATIVASQGKYGWDDYHLIHHFDEEEPRDTLFEHVEREDW